MPGIKKKVKTKFAGVALVQLGWNCKGSFEGYRIILFVVDIHVSALRLIVVCVHVQTSTAWWSSTTDRTRLISTTTNVTLSTMTRLPATACRGLTPQPGPSVLYNS